jgi:hypothetical protein
MKELRSKRKGSIIIISVIVRDGAAGGVMTIRGVIGGSLETYRGTWHVASDDLSSSNKVRPSRLLRMKTSVSPRKQLLLLLQ